MPQTSAGEDSEIVSSGAVNSETVNSETVSSGAVNSAAVNAVGDSIDRVVFFDGVCGMCNGTVDFLMKRDPSAKLKFAPLQGATAAQILPESVRKNLDTFVYLENGELYFRSTALARILRELGGLWAFLGSVLWLIPSPIRNLGYRCVSQIRYRIGGQKESCRVPTASERARFFD